MGLTYVSLTPAQNDTEVQLLGKILQRIGTFAAPSDNATLLLSKLLTALNTASSGASGTNASGDFSVSPIWTDGATHTGLKVNVTDTSSDSASNYVDFQVGGTSKFSIPKSTGFVTIPGVLEVGVFTWSKTLDASSNTSPVAFEAYHETSGGAGGGANNGGVAIDFRADSDTTDRQLQGRVATLWTDATHASQVSHMRFSLVSASVATECLRLSVGAVDIRGTTALQINAVAYHNPLSVYATGTVYTLTNASAGVDFGTIDPIVTLNAVGTYALRARVKVALNGATFAANRTLTLKLRRTNNTAADVASSTTTYIVPIVATITNTLAIIDLPEVFYTTALTTDTIQIFSDISTVPSAGSITIDEASIIAVRLS